jgi:K+-transporting ATPase ATPase A chain
MTVFLIHPIIILIPTFLAYSTGAAAAIGLPAGAVGFTRVFYEYTSAASNNGSDFIGSSAQFNMFFNISTGIVMLIGRFLPIGLLLALSGSMINRRRTVAIGLQTDNPIFAFVLVASIIVLVLLTFFPFLILGPILEFFQGKLNGY